MVLTATHAAHKLNLLEMAALSCWQLVHPVLMILCWLTVLVDDVIAAHRAWHGRWQLTILTHDLDRVRNLVVNRLLTMRLKDVLSVAYLSVFCPSWSRLVWELHISTLIITAFFMLDQRFRRFFTILSTTMVQIKGFLQSFIINKVVLWTAHIYGRCFTFWINFSF